MPSGVQTTTSQEIYIGAAEIWKGAVPAQIGATQDDCVMRLSRTYYTPNINGVKAGLTQTDHLVEEMVELEFTLVEMSAARLALVIPGAVVTPNSPGASDNAISAGTSLRAVAGDYDLWSARVPGAGTRAFHFVLLQGFCVEFGEITAAEDGNLSCRIKVQGRVDPTNPTNSIWEIREILP